MAELILRVIDKRRTGKPEIDSGRRMAWDEVGTCRSGHPWSERERTNPEWRIIEVIDLPVPEDLTDPLGFLCVSEEAYMEHNIIKRHVPRLGQESLKVRANRLFIPQLLNYPRSRVGPDLRITAGEALLCMRAKPSVGRLAA